MNFEQAKICLNVTHDLVKDDKAKIQHHLNTETGESYISYKPVYLMQSRKDKRIQTKIKKPDAIKLAAILKTKIADLPNAFDWSSLS